LDDLNAQLVKRSAKLIVKAGERSLKIGENLSVGFGPSPSSKRQVLKKEVARTHVWLEFFDARLNRTPLRSPRLGVLA
jgi:hypothetical protein